MLHVQGGSSYSVTEKVATVASGAAANNKQNQPKKRLYPDLVDNFFPPYYNSFDTEKYHLHPFRRNEFLKFHRHHYHINDNVAAMPTTTAYYGDNFDDEFCFVPESADQQGGPLLLQNLSGRFKSRPRTEGK